MPASRTESRGINPVASKLSPISLQAVQSRASVPPARALIRNPHNPRKHSWKLLTRQGPIPRSFRKGKDPHQGLQSFIRNLEAGYVAESSRPSPILLVNLPCQIPQTYFEIVSVITEAYRGLHIASSVLAGLTVSVRNQRVAGAPDKLPIGGVIGAHSGLILAAALKNWPAVKGFEVFRGFWQ